MQALAEHAPRIFNDPERYAKTYWSDVPGFYFTGDSARRDPDGYFWIMGRVDDVINVSGHRLARWRSRAPSSPTRPSPRPPASACRTR